MTNRIPFALVFRLLLAGWLGISAPCPQAAIDPKASGYYEDALKRYDKHDLPGAIVQLKNAVQADPKMLSAQLLLGKALLANGEVAAAEVALSEALALGVSRTEVVQPLAQSLVGQGKPKALFDRPELQLGGLPAKTRFQLHLLRAGANADLGNPREAMAEVDDARRIDAATAESWIAEVPLRIRARQFREAIAAAERAIALAPESADAWSQRAAALHASGNILEALKAYDAALSRSDKLDEARIARAGIYIDLNRYADAKADLAVLKEHNAQEPRTNYLRAMVAESDHDEASAKAALSEVVAFLDPIPIEYIRYRPQLLMLGGLSHFALGNADKAKGYLESIQASGGLPSAKVLAQIYLTERNPSRAQSLLEAYLRYNPRDSHGIMLLASAHLAAGRSHRATALMEEALSLTENPRLRAALGQSLLSGGRTEDAIAQFEKAFNADPGQSASGFMLVGLYIQARQPAKALSIANAVVKRSPDAAMSHNLLGVAKSAMRDAVGARAAFERAVKLEPSLVVARINLAKLEIGANEYDKADQRLKQMLKENEKNLDALLALALLEERRGRFEGAQRALERARDAEGPQRVAAALQLVEFHLRRKNPAPALEAAKYAHSKAPEDFDTLLVYANVRRMHNDIAGARLSLKDASRVADTDADRLLKVALMQNLVGDATAAQYSLDKALGARPGFLGAEALLADVEMRLGELAKSERRARAIVDAEPKRAIGHSLLGDIAVAKGQPSAAVDAYRRAHQIEPSGETLLRLYRAMSRAGEGKGSIALAEAWLKSNPKDIAVRRALADGHAREKNFSAARKLYEEILRVLPKDVGVLNNLANVQLLTKDLAGAQKTAEAALAIEPGNPHVIDTLGWAAFLAGQNEKAIGYLRDARLRNPENPTVRFHLASALAKAGRNKEAIDELDSALKSAGPYDEQAEARALRATLK